MSFFSIISTLSAFLLLICVLLYRQATSTYSYFTKLNVQHDKPRAFFGSLFDFYLRKDSYFGVIIKQYEKYKHRSFFGMYDHREPAFIITDPAIICRITTTDFDHFTNHRPLYDNDSVLGLSVNMLKDDRWRSMRSALSPVYSAENLQFMFYLTEENANLAIDSLKKNMEFQSTVEIDMQDFLSRFIIDTVTSTTLGIKPNSLMTNRNAFYTHAKNTFKYSAALYGIFFLKNNFPALDQLIKISYVPNDCVSYFNTLVRQIMEYRQQNNIKRFDILQLLMQKKQTTLPMEEKESKSFSEDEIVAQCLTVILHGLFETARTASIAIVELAANPRIQYKVQKEIDMISVRTNGDITSYEALSQMDYLDMVVFETIRKWPCIYAIDRECTKPYTLVDRFDGHSVDLKPGDVIYIPVMALHKDVNYFKNPEKFDPERFSEENRKFIKPYTFIPFGLGPRNCMGSKFSVLQIKEIIVSILSQFQVEPVSGTDSNVLCTDRGFYLTPKHGTKVRLKRRNLL